MDNRIHALSVMWWGRGKGKGLAWGVVHWNLDFNVGNGSGGRVTQW